MAKKNILFALVVLMLFALILPAAADVPAHKETLVIGSNVDINNLNIYQQNDQINNIIIKLTHDGLIFNGNDATMYLGNGFALAESYEYTDETHILWHLKQGVTWSDGSPFTAEDVKFSYDMILDSPRAGTMKGYVGMEIIDDYTFIMEVEGFNNEFVVQLSNPIQSKKAWESGMEEPWLVGTGRYKVVEWIEGEYVKLEKVANHWDTERPAVSDYIIFRPILEDSSRVIALQNGEIDVCILPPTNELYILEEDPNVTVFQRAGSRLFYFGFNVTKEPWDNKTLRQAVACAINRQDVIEVAVSGLGTPQTTILNRGLWGFYDEMEGFNYDLDRAKALMAEAGYPDGGIKTTMLIANSSPYLSIAQVIQDNLKQIGITVELQTVEDATLKSECIAGNNELFLWRWNEDVTDDQVYRELYNTGMVNNYHHYSNPHIDELTDAILVEPDQQKRYEIGVELQETLVEECPQVPLYIADLVIAYNKDLKGEYLYGGGNHNWSWAYIAE